MELETLKKAKHIESLIDSIKTKISAIKGAVERAQNKGKDADYIASISNQGIKFNITQKEFIKLARKKIVKYEGQLVDLVGQLEKLEYSLINKINAKVCKKANRD